MDALLTSQLVGAYEKFNIGGAMSKLPKKSMNDIINETIINDNNRTYIGYSSAGNSCARAIWYGFYWATEKSHSARIDRLFKLGHDTESVMVNALRLVGISVSYQQKEIIGPHKHIMGHIDGIAVGIPGDEKTEHLAEFKTMKDNLFNKLKKEGVRKSNRRYYAQMQAYMGKLELSKGLFVCYNKNTSEIYTEIIDFDPTEFDVNEHKLIDVLYSELAPDKIGEKTWFACKLCDFYSVCHNDEPVAKNCRTCEYHSVEDEGKHSCTRYKKKLNTLEQRAGCSTWTIKEVLK